MRGISVQEKRNTYVSGSAPSRAGRINVCSIRLSVRESMAEAIRMTSPTLNGQREYRMGRT